MLVVDNLVYLFLNQFQERGMGYQDWRRFIGFFFNFGGGIKLFLIVLYRGGLKFIYLNQCLTSKENEKKIVGQIISRVCYILYYIIIIIFFVNKYICY